jgi:hypothetical protein
MRLNFAEVYAPAQETRPMANYVLVVDLGRIQMDHFSEWIVSENAIQECAHTRDQIAVELGDRMMPNAPA